MDFLNWLTPTCSSCRISRHRGCMLTHLGWFFCFLVSDVQSDRSGGAGWDFAGCSCLPDGYQGHHVIASNQPPVYENKNVPLSSKLLFCIGLCSKHNPVFAVVEKGKINKVTVCTCDKYNDISFGQTDCFDLFSKHNPAKLSKVMYIDTHWIQTLEGNKSWVLYFSFSLFIDLPRFHFCSSLMFSN